MDQDQANIEDGQKMLQRERTSRERYPCVCAVDSVREKCTCRHYQETLQAQHTRRRSLGESTGGGKYDQVSTIHSDMGNGPEDHDEDLDQDRYEKPASNITTKRPDRNTPRCCDL